MSARRVGKHGKSEPRNPAGRSGAPVSLYPLSFREAVEGLAQVKMPEPDKKKQKATKKT